jgi:hypothetical protein
VTARLFDRVLGLVPVDLGGGGFSQVEAGAFGDQQKVDEDVVALLARTS